MLLPEIRVGPNGMIADSSSPELLHELLVEYERRLVGFGVPLGDWLQPGVDADRLTNQLGSVGLGTPDELAVWFGWHNGTIPNPTYAASSFALPGILFAPIEVAIAQYKAMTIDFVPPRDAITSPIDDWWPGAGEGWLLLEYGSRGVTVNCQEPPDDPLRLHHIFPDFDDLEVDGVPLWKAQSLCTLVTWWHMSLDSGAVNWNSGTQRWEDGPGLTPSSQVAAHF
jgi:hypothetical protein